MKTFNSNTFVCIITVIGFIIPGCTKDYQSNVKAMLPGTWQFVEWSGYCPLGNKTSSPKSYKDNTLTLNADGTFIINYGAERGSGEPSNNVTGKWEYTSGKKRGELKATSGKFKLSWDIQSFVIVEIQENYLLMEWSLAPQGHPKGPTVFTFKK